MSMTGGFLQLAEPAGSANVPPHKAAKQTSVDLEAVRNELRGLEMSAKNARDVRYQKAINSDFTIEDNSKKHFCFQ